MAYNRSKAGEYRAEPAPVTDKEGLPMKRAAALILALLMAMSLGVTALAKDADEDLQVIRCPEMGFSTRTLAEYKWKYTARDGITIYTERQGSIPYVLVFRMEDWIVDAADYIREQYTPHMEKQYGSNLVSAKELDSYTIGGRELAVGLYTYKLQGYLIDMIRAYEVQDRHTVVYTAKYIRGRGDATLAALDQAVAGYRPDPDYYASAEEFCRWDHTVTDTPEGDICCTFADVQITLPAAWKGLYSIGISERGISFYHSMSRRLWEEDGYRGGLLFTLAWSEKQDYDYLPSFEDIGPGETGYYYLIYPTDAQAYNSTMAMKEYQEMFGEIGFIAENARILIVDGTLKG